MCVREREREVDRQGGTEIRPQKYREIQKERERGADRDIKKGGRNR